MVLIVPSFPKLSETFIVSKFSGLLQKGWDVQVVCNESDPAQWKHFPELARHPESKRRVELSWPHRPRWLAAGLVPVALAVCLWHNLVGTLRYLRLGGRRFGWNVLRRLYLDARLLQLRPDLVHFEFGALAVGRMYLKELLKCKIIVSFRGYDLNMVGLEKQNYYQEVWDKADALHLLGVDLWRRAHSRGCPVNKAHVLIPPAINLGLFEPAKSTSGASPADPIRILSVGRLEWKKGYEHAIQAVRVLKDLGVSFRYRIIGDGSQLEPLAFARHQLDVEAEVEFLGAISPSEVKRYLSHSDIFLHAAVSEGFCNAVLEAQAMGLPVVTSDADGLPENVVDGVTGFVVPRRNPQALADKLQLLARDSEFRARMGQAGRKRVLQHFQIQDQIGAFDRFYRSVMECATHRGPVTGESVIRKRLDPAPSASLPGSQSVQEVAADVRRL